MIKIHFNLHNIFKIVFTSSYLSNTLSLAKWLLAKAYQLIIQFLKSNNVYGKELLVQKV